MGLHDWGPNLQILSVMTSGGSLLPETEAKRRDKVKGRLIDWFSEPYKPWTINL